jgi:septin 3/9/12
MMPDESIRTTTEIHPVSHVIEENGVRLRLNIVDTPGYGDLVNNDRCWDPIVKYIKDQHSAYLRKELTAQRERYIQDTRIHCCLFFIQPSGHSLKPIDIVVLKKLSDVVNVVPVIAKADTLTLEERQVFKERIKEEFAFHNLKMYPYDNEEFDEEERAHNTQIKVCPLEATAPPLRAVLTLMQTESHPLRCGRIGEVDYRQRQASPRPPEPVGSHQR